MSGRIFFVKDATQKGIPMQISEFARIKLAKDFFDEDTTIMQMLVLAIRHKLQKEHRWFGVAHATYELLHMDDKATSDMVESYVRYLRITGTKPTALMIEVGLV